MKFCFNYSVVLLVLVTSMINGELSAKDPRAGISGMTSAHKQQYDVSKVNMLVFYAGAAAGGKQNTCYFLKSKIILAGSNTLGGSVFFNLHGDRLYDANVSFGNNVAFTVGMEWGDRLYFVNRDSTLEHIHFKNTATGAYATYASFAGVTFPEVMKTYEMGVTFGGKFPSINYWRGRGRCWSIVSIKFELLYAPKIDYSETYDVTTQGAYQANTDTYFLEGASVRHMGYRLVIDTRLSSKIGMMMEAGTRPGLKSELNEEHRFSNGYLRIGVEVGIVVGGRKALKAAKMEDPIQD